MWVATKYPRKFKAPHELVGLEFAGRSEFVGKFRSDARSVLSASICGQAISEFESSFQASRRRHSPLHRSGQFSCRCRNSNVPFPLIEWGPLKNSISVRSLRPSLT